MAVHPIHVSGRKRKTAGKIKVVEVQDNGVNCRTKRTLDETFLRLTNDIILNLKPMMNHYFRKTILGKMQRIILTSTGFVYGKMRKLCDKQLLLF